MKATAKRKKQSRTTSSTVYRLKVTLRHIAPPIWRRLEVPADTKLPRLHRILQMAMGWYDAHLHAFGVNGTSFGIPNPNFPDDETVNERNVRLDQMAAQGDKFTYEYDFGDGWEHDILVEKVLPPESGARYPRCLVGKRACPPEDCGGPPGYAHLLEVLSDPKHEEHDEMREWIGGDFDPEAFDLDAVKEELWKLK